MTSENKNFYVINSWGREVLDLKGNELELFSLIYTFCQNGIKFYASISYMEKWLGTSKQTVVNTLDSLINKKLIIKESIKGSCLKNYYSINYQYINSLAKDVSNYNKFNRNRIVIYYGMINLFNLSGNELILYALIYNSFKFKKERFSGSLNYIKEWLGASKQTVVNTIKSLINKKLIIKETIKDGNLKNYYSLNMETITNFNDNSKKMTTTKNLSSNEALSNDIANTDSPKNCMDDNGGSKNFGKSSQTFGNNNILNNNIKDKLINNNIKTSNKNYIEPFKKIDDMDTYIAELPDSQKKQELLSLKRIGLPYDCTSYIKYHSFSSYTKFIMNYKILDNIMHYTVLDDKIKDYSSKYDFNFLSKVISYTTKQVKKTKNIRNKLYYFIVALGNNIKSTLNRTTNTITPNFWDNIRQNASARA